MLMYIIKNNLPKARKHLSEHPTRDDAVKTFWRIYSWVKKSYPTSITLRNDIDKDARGTIKTEIDGFYYYVELFKNE